MFHVEHFDFNSVPHERARLESFLLTPEAELEWTRFPGMELQVDIPNAFIGKLEKPTPRELADALGPAIETWNQLVAKLGRLGVVNQEWSSYSPKYGWHLKLKIKKRNILYLGPCNRLVRVSLVLGDRAVKAAHESKLSAKVIALLDKAPKYAEGTGLILLMKGASEIPSVMKLAAIKLAN